MEPVCYKQDCLRLYATNRTTWDSMLRTGLPGNLGYQQDSLGPVRYEQVYLGLTGVLGTG